MNESLCRANAKRRQYDYAAGQQILLKVPDPTKLGPRTEGPYTIDRVHVNGNVTFIWRPGVMERINIRRIRPFRAWYKHSNWETLWWATYIGLTSVQIPKRILQYVDYPFVNLLESLSDQTIPAYTNGTQSEWQTFHRIPWWRRPLLIEASRKTEVFTLEDQGSFCLTFISPQVYFFPGVQVLFFSLIWLIPMNNRCFVHGGEECYATSNSPCMILEWYSS